MRYSAYVMVHNNMMGRHALYSDSMQVYLWCIDRGVYGLSQSVQVLCLCNGYYSIVKCEQYEDDCMKWVSTCSNHWTIEYPFYWFYIIDGA